MKRHRYLGTVFWLVVSLIWVPWTTWYAIDTYVLGNEDMKFGRDGGFIFASLMYAYISFASSLSAVVVRLFDSSLFQPISPRQARLASVGIGLSLSALSPLVSRLDVPGLSDVTGTVVAWVAISAAVCAVCFAAVRAVPAQPGAAGDAQ
jgi:hypothetical protein